MLPSAANLAASIPKRKTSGGDFGQGEPVRATRVPPDNEVRAYATPNEAGQQSLTSTQLAAGGAFVPVGVHERAFATMQAIRPNVRLAILQLGGDANGREHVVPGLGRHHTK